MSWLESKFVRLGLLPLLLLTVACGNDDPADPDPDPDPDPDGYAFVYTPPAGAPAVTSVHVAGEFNAWNETSLPMTQRTDGSWVAYVELDSATTYMYKFRINGAWISNMCSDATWGHASQGGLVHLETDECVDDGFGGGNAVITLAGEPGLSFTHVASDPAYVSIAAGRLSVRFRARRDMVSSARLVMGSDTIAMHHQFEWGLTDVWRASTATTAGSYTILAATTEGAQTFGPYSVPAGVFRSVDWVANAVGYQIFPDRFWNGDPSNDSLALTTDEFHYNELWTSGGPTLAASWDAPPSNQHCCHQYFGGDIQGIIDRMDHLVDLGVTAIYLNPIWHSGSAHGYDAFDYRLLAPEFGDSATLRTFVDVAHANGIHLIWDFVPNHTGLGFWAFQDAIENGSSSPYWDWYRFHPSGNGLQAGDGADYDGWFGIASLPQLQTVNPEVTAHLMEVAEDWTEYGFDGIRVDVPLQLAERDATFFPEFRDRMKAVDPDVYLVGEVWYRDAGWLQGDQFDALMNYSLARDVVSGFANGSMNAASAWSNMVTMFATYSEAATAMLFNLTASHDTGRLLTLLGGGGSLTAAPSATAIERQKLAAAFQYALPGMPVTYYGDECAMTGSGPESQSDLSRRRMDWSRCAADAHGMVQHYARLAEEKQSLPALASPVVRAHQSAGSVLSFYRGEPGAGEMLAVFNQGNAVDFALPAGSWVDALAPGTPLSGTVNMPARGWRYLVRQ